MGQLTNTCFAAQSLPEHYIRTLNVPQRLTFSLTIHSRMFCLLIGLLAFGASLPIISSRDVPGKDITPLVYVYDPHPDELRLGLEHVGLTCLVQGFYPDLWTRLHWYQNNNALPESNYVSTPILKDKIEKSSFAYSRLRIKRSSWEKGDEFTCLLLSGFGAQGSVRKS